MILREEIGDDVVAVRQVVTAAFGQDEEADLVEALRISGDAVISLVAEDEGEIVGHVLFSKLVAPEGCLALAPVSVVPSHQGMGIGSGLIREGLIRAKHEGWKGIFVVGEPDYYKRFGFSAEVADKFEVPYPKAYFMGLELVPGSLHGLEGKVVYTNAFLGL